jgi:hypothetical protein
MEPRIGSTLQLEMLKISLGRSQQITMGRKDLGTKTSVE